MRPLPVVFRVESFGEQPDPFPSLPDAMRSAPTHAESHIATSVPKGIVLAQSTVRSSSRKQLRVTFEWRLTVAGNDVIEGGVRGLARAS